MTSGGVNRRAAPCVFPLTAVTGRVGWGRVMRGSVLAAAVTTVVAALAGPGVAGSAQPRAAGPDARATAPGGQLWVSRFPADGSELFNTEVVSPDGSRVFVTGASSGGRLDRDDFETVAYAAATGKQLWARSYSGPGKLYDEPSAIAVSPDGRAVFVTGDSGRALGDGYATVAYDAATGRQLWASRYHGPVPGLDRAASVAISPGGREVLVTGDIKGRGTRAYDYATVAYKAATGKQLWATLYHAPDNDGSGSSVAVNPAGITVFVTGWTQTRTADYTTIGYHG
jgi:hypothetical protein